MSDLIIVKKPAAVPPGHEERSDIVDLDIRNIGWLDRSVVVQTTQPYSGGHPNGEGVKLETIVIPFQSTVEVFNVYPDSIPEEIRPK